MWLQCPSPDRSRPDARGGFTLIELLVALLIGALVAGSLIRVIEGSTRFVELLSAREEVQQNARAALDLIVGELRGVPPAAIVTMEADAVRFRHPRAWGILCGALLPTSTVAEVVFPADLIPEDDYRGRPQWGLGVEQTDDPEVPVGDFRFVTNLTADDGGGGACDSVVSAGSSGQRSLAFTEIGPGALVAGDRVAAGALVMLFEELRYDVREGGAVPGRWIRRMTGYSGSSPNMQPIAGPVAEGSGLRLEYLRGDGTPAGWPEEVRDIDLTVGVRSRAAWRGGAAGVPEAEDSVAVRVHLRNGGR